ncbi:kinectin-like isoform X3 [Aethina tumida]|uniref:kinectin-like isoform X3 n=1 Tax=Aethina tumida TaxID=116153 RepID=UPI002148F59D|nr:kinectin-like isoform X3 [Aethina tumida]
MHHLYPGKGDPLCPLGFHPQVRWPTRCKRCFRDYKEHGGKRRDEDSLRRDDRTASTPSLSWNPRDSESEKRRIWVSSTNLASDRNELNRSNSGSDESDYSNPSSWTSTPDLANLEDDTQPTTTVSLKLPKRKIKAIDTGQRTVSDSVSFLKDKSLVYNKNDSLATRAKKLQAIKERNSEGVTKRIQIKEVKTISEEPTNHDVQFLIQVKRQPKKQESSEEENDDNVSMAGTETTDTTLVDFHENELREQYESLKKELEASKSKCERLEREKSDFLLRRLAAMETTTSKTTATEVLKLQQKCNEMQQLLEDVKDEKRSLSLRVKELEEDIELRPTAQQAQKIADELRSKLLAAETLCEELMDENEDIKKELRDMEEQMEEMQDNFREDQADRYTSIKKELDQTTKNCRILSFKLRKAERKTEQLETEKTDLEKKLKEVSGGTSTLSHLDRIKALEQELKVSNEVSLRLQKELEEANRKIEETKPSAAKKKPPLLGSIGKAPSGDGKVSRESLTRGGSQDDPAQLLRDLQDSLEREADLREQLKFAEEESSRLAKRKHGKIKRVFSTATQTLLLDADVFCTDVKYTLHQSTQTQCDKNSVETCDIAVQASEEVSCSEMMEVYPRNNFITALQSRNMLMSKIYQPARVFSPMATILSAMGRKLSPTNQRLTPEPQEKDVSEDDDPAELKLQLELSEHEASLLRKKVEDLESDNHRLKTKNKDLQDKCTKTTARRSLLGNDKGGAVSTQKLKVLEDESNELRKKLIEKERDCERLHAELSLNQKRSKGMQKTKSLDMDQQTLDLKRQLQVIDQEASVLRNKVQSLETENEKLIAENKKLSLLRGTKSKSSEKNLDKYIDQIAKLEIELGEAQEKIKALESSPNSVNSKTGEIQSATLKKFTQRTPKKVTALTSRDQLKTMVSDLEKEIGEMLVSWKLSESAKLKLEEEKGNGKNKLEYDKMLKDIEEMKKKYEAVQKELTEERAKVLNENKKYEDLNKTLNQTKESLEKSVEEKNKLKEQIEKSSKEQHKLLEDKKKLDDEISKLRTNLKNALYKQDEVTLLTQKSESLKLDLENKNKELSSLKKELEEKVKEIEAGKEKIKNMENEQLKLEEDKRKLNNQVEDLNTKVKGLENSIEQKNKHIKQLEESLNKEREIVSKTNLKVGELENREINKLKDDLSKKKVQLSELESKLEIAAKNQRNLEDKLKKSDVENKNNKLEIEKKNKELEIDLQNERKKLEVIKANHEKEQKNRELELSSLKSKIKKLELNSGTGKTEIKHFQETIEKLELTIDQERRRYDDLTVKYEMLEEEHVVTKAKLVMEKETVDNQLLNLKKETSQLESELKTLRDTYNSKQDTWIKEKLSMEEKLKDAKKVVHNGNDYEKSRLKSSLEEVQSELEQLKKEYSNTNDQMEFMRKENDELKKKLDDYERVNKVQRNISADSTAMEKEIRQLKIKLSNSEKNKKSDLAEYKIRYESQLSIVNGELQSLQNQVMRFKRERDNYKHMLEAAQKTIGDLKQSPKSVKDGASKIVQYDELEESKTKVQTLEQQVSCMEDELSESRLECSRLKTELVSERSSWEVKLSEFQSRINELEEEKILNSGRTKIVGLRTRMELAWQKEREEQQRLLQETATLARDLRQTLFEVERERDKERLEAKRKQDQFKKSSEEEQEENKKKITELQCDLLELRDAHAKLRTTNEKLRREKERYEKEREEFKTMINGKKRADIEDDRKISAIIEHVDTLKQFAPELFFSKETDATYTPTPPRRTKSKSRETSPAGDRRDTPMSADEKQQQIYYIMQRIVNTTEDLRRIQRMAEDEYERERIKRAMGMRRATSSEHEADSRYSRPYLRQSPIVTKPLQRKSLSLEQTNQNEQKIWKGDNDSVSSLQSLEFNSDVEAMRSRRDTSLDSRLSGGSTQSDFGEKKKKKGIMGKLKKLTKSRSIDDQDPGTFSPSRSLSSRPNSNSEVNEERGSKKDLRERITGMFKKSGSSSRSNSMERQRHDTSSTQRPLMRNGSNGNLHSSSSDIETPKKGKSKRS